MTTPKTPARRTTTAAKPAARKPQDRKPKASAADEAPTITVTVDDVTVTVDSEKLDDYELMEDIARVDDGEHIRIGRVLVKLLGRDVHDQVKEMFRDVETGKIPMEPIIEFFHKILAAMQAEVDARG